MCIDHWTTKELITFCAIAWALGAVGMVFLFGILNAARDRTDPHMPVVGHQNFEEPRNNN